MRKFAGMRTMLTAAACAVASGCSLFGEDVWESRAQALASQRARWERQDADSYRYTTHVSCECLAAIYGSVIVEVRQGAVVGVTPVQPGRTPPPQNEWPAFSTVEQLFARVESAIETRAYQFRVVYDRARGFPTLISLDLDRDYVDDELAIQASDLVVLD